uniref:Uncharacterized protein n=1 Tax=Oryza brachyantha TaxID=4533 RepID=J3LBZ5_ORYBR
MRFISLFGRGRSSNASSRPQQCTMHYLGEPMLLQKVFFLFLSKSQSGHITFTKVFTLNCHINNAFTLDYPSKHVEARGCRRR